MPHKKDTFSLLLSFGLCIVAMITTMPMSVSAYVMPYQQLLAEHITFASKKDIPTALVDYPAWGQDPRHTQAMQSLTSIDPKPLTGAEKMAFWINAYNLLTIDLIITTNETESIKNQGTLLKNVWKSHRWSIFGRPYTLHEIEHAILRPMGDPRIHMAINCASLSCPDLRTQPYVAKTLDADLTEQTQHFIANTQKGMQINTKNKLVVSSIFKWFAGDFNGKQGVQEFIHNTMDLPAGATIAGYLPYDWSLNNL